MFSWITRIIKGMIIALGFILPGVSGGVLAAILGIYNRMINFLAHIRQDFIDNIRFFFPIGIGGILGISLFSMPVEYLLIHYKLPVLWGFSGAIIGSLPSLWSESSQNHQRDKYDWSWLIATFLLSGLMLYSLDTWVGALPANFATFILAGSLMALGILVPGLSPSNLLLILGLYSPMLTGFKQLDLLGTFLPIAVGAGLTILCFSKFMDYALKNYHSRCYHFIIGILLSSTLLILIPNATNPESISYQNVTNFSLVLTLISFILGIILGYWMSRLEEKYK